MSKLDLTKRLTFLAEKFDVFEAEDTTSATLKCQANIDDGWESSQPIKSNSGNIIGIITSKLNKRGFIVNKVSISYDVFTSMVGADPTPNKICLQWMLNTFSRLLKVGKLNEASMFVEEDLPQANQYLTVFEANKRKNRFKEIAKYTLKDFKDVGNINEYRNLEQLFNVVDPFIERDASGFEGLLERFVKRGQGDVVFRDRKYTVFIPLTLEANEIFNNFVEWCTTNIGNQQFSRYTEDNKRPNGDNSKLYVIIDNGFFTGENQNLYQVHAETNQIKDRTNSIENIDLYNEVLQYSEGLVNYFESEFSDFAKVGGEDNRCYIDMMGLLGFTEYLFNDFEDDTPIINIDSLTSSKRIIPKLPNMSRFTNLSHLVILKSSLCELHPTVMGLNSLAHVTLVGNNLKTIPNEVCKLKYLMFLNLSDNPIDEINDDIKYLDSSNGGNLVRLGITKENMSETNYRKLKTLLPNVEIR